MKTFWIKAAAVSVIAIVMFMYQAGAHSNARMNEVVNELKSQLEESAEKKQSAGLYKDGAFEGTGTGYKGEIKVRVTVSSGNITEVEILENKDDHAYFQLASELTKDIVEKQGTGGVDTVSGATFSSNGILEAVSNALEGASD